MIYIYIIIFNLLLNTLDIDYFYINDWNNLYNENIDILIDND